MAALAGTIDTSYVIMKDNWPGGVDFRRAVPQDGFAELGAVHHNVAPASVAVQLGTKIPYYDTTNKGWSTLIYLAVGTQASVILAARQLVLREYETTNTLWYVVTNDPDLANVALSPAAVALSAMTNTYLGWFWCGGVCPETLITALAGNLLVFSEVNGVMIAGAAVVIDEDTTDTLGLASPTAVTDVIACYTTQVSTAT